MTEPFISTTSFTVDDPQAYVDYWIEEFEDHGFDYHQPSLWRLEMSTPYGDGSMDLDGQTVTVELKCHDLTSLFDVRGGIGHHLEEFDPRLANIAWTGANMAGEMPPNFKLARVVACEDVSPSYQRMTVEGADMARFGQTGLHFRIVRQKNPDRAPVWPVMGAKGTAVWPEGADTLTDKVYTTRYFDADTGRLTFDIFRHAGGFTCEWAATRPIGQTVGVMGPGGGWYPHGHNLLLVGDETALPAIARILENAASDSTGQAIILVPSAADVQPINAPKGCQITWLFRDQDTDLVAAAKAAGTDFDFHWFAAHQDEARAMRTFWKTTQGIDRKAFMSVAYWE